LERTPAVTAQGQRKRARLAWPQPDGPRRAAFDAQLRREDDEQLEASRALCGRELDGRDHLLSLQSALAVDRKARGYDGLAAEHRCGDDREHEGRRERDRLDTPDDKRRDQPYRAERGI